MDVEAVELLISPTDVGQGGGPSQLSDGSAVGPQVAIAGDPLHATDRQSLLSKAAPGVIGLVVLLPVNQQEVGVSVGRVAGINADGEAQEIVVAGPEHADAEGRRHQCRVKAVQHQH